MRVIRTCIGCRKRACITDLFRVASVARGDMRYVVPDVERRLEGRGAWLHPDSACLALAERRRAFGRALRYPGPIDIGPLRDHDMLSG
jgi:predicted RNA-binding protein YlxR (DUF448 family)